MIIIVTKQLVHLNKNVDELAENRLIDAYCGILPEHLNAISILTNAEAPSSEIHET